MIPEIKIIAAKKLIGQRIEMSFSEDRTFQLWHNFMPRRKEIRNNLTNDLFSLQVYPDYFDFKNFNPAIRFEKWAAVEVPDFKSIPGGMKSFILPGGLYAVFIHRGAATEGPKTFRHIFGTWLPGSDYLLEDRPHFEILDEKYKNNNPASEEEIWIPIKPK